MTEGRACFYVPIAEIKYKPVVSQVDIMEMHLNTSRLPEFKECSSFTERYVRYFTDTFESKAAKEQV